jgi:hypothetical protein
VRYEAETLLEVGKDDRTILNGVISSHSSHLRHFRAIMETFRDDTKQLFGGSLEAF